MAIFKNLLGIREIKSPVFYKEFIDENRQLIDLIELRDKVKSNKREYIERDIAFLKNGVQGEKNVYFELKNSFIPMIELIIQTSFISFHFELIFKIKIK